MKSVTRDISALQTVENNLTYDNVQAAKPNLKFNDKANAKVIQTNLEKVLNNNLLFATPVTMSSRDKAFKIVACMKRSGIQGTL